MSRAKWKGPSFGKNSLENFQNSETHSTKIKIARNSVILPKFLKKTFEVHNGKQLHEILVSEEMIGYRFGEFVPTRKRFSFKKKKKSEISMGQKTNPIIFRLGKIKEWKSHYIEKKTTESSAIIFQDLEIKKYIHQLFLTHGFKIHNSLIYFSSESLHIYISYYNLTKPSLLNKKKFKLIYKKLLSENFEKKESTIKVRSIKDHMYKIKTYKKKIFKKHKLFRNHYLLVKKNQRLINVSHAENYFNKKKYRTLDQEKGDSFISKILKGINLFTKKRYNIFLNLNQINKEENIVRTIKKKNKFKLRRKLLELRKYQQNEFFKSGLNILYSFTLAGQDPTFLANFIAYYLRKLKRPTFFLRFLAVTLKTLLASKFSDLTRIQIKIRGRLNRSPRSKIKSISIGKSIPIATINSHVDYGESTAYTSNGTLGIKIWTLKLKQIQC